MKGSQCVKQIRTRRAWTRNSPRRSKVVVRGVDGGFVCTWGLMGRHGPVDAKGPRDIVRKRIGIGVTDRHGR